MPGRCRVLGCPPVFRLSRRNACARIAWVTLTVSPAVRTRKVNGRPMVPDMSQRQAAMVLLDAVSAFDPHEGDTPQNEAAVRLALKRLTEIDAITATRDDETGETRVNADSLIIGALSIITLLVGTVAEDRNVDRALVLSTIRDIVGPTFDN